MTWFKVDDGAPRHQKMRAAGKLGRALWNAAGPECAAQRTDGRVSPLLLKDAAYLAEVPAKAAAALVTVGLWHDAETIKACRSCRDCMKLEPGEFYFHDWLDYQPTRDETELPEGRQRVKRKRALAKDRALCDAIWERDRGLCRYCAVRVNSKDRRGATGMTYDHVDPAGPNSYENVVLACRKCNGHKRDRTPLEAGMELLPIPAPYLVEIQSGSDRDQVQTGSDLAPASRDTRDGPDRVGVGFGSGRAQVGPSVVE